MTHNFSNNDLKEINESVKAGGGGVSTIDLTDTNLFLKNIQGSSANAGNGLIDLSNGEKFLETIKNSLKNPSFGDAITQLWTIQQNTNTIFTQINNVNEKLNTLVGLNTNQDTGLGYNSEIAHHLESEEIYRDLPHTTLFLADPDITVLYGELNSVCSGNNAYVNHTITFNPLNGMFHLILITK
jgi:hypothetical protein